MNDKAMLALQLMRNMEGDVIAAFKAACRMPSELADPERDEYDARGYLKDAFDTIYAVLMRTKDEE